jgi:A/G-specific adenine glycosylase
MMLQQTQVDTVIPYFHKFTTQWPTVNELSKADLDDVLRLWQGLGYYARARNLYKCAQMIAEHFGGAFPESPADLVKLPGIGPYASAAIAAIAFNIPATVVDGNVARIVSRVFGFSTPIRQNQKHIYSAAERLTPRLRAGDYAQGLMDLGSGICTPRSPKCNACPLQSNCKAHASGTPEHYPGRPEKPSIPTRYAVAFICIKNNQLLLRKRTGQKMLQGLWELPGSDWYLDSLPELPDDILEPYVDVKHTFSHFHLITRVVQVSEVEVEYLNGGEIVCNIDDLDQLAFSTLTQKLLKFRLT